LVALQGWGGRSKSAKSEDCEGLGDMYMPLLATVGDPDERKKGRKMRRPSVKLWYLRYLQSCVNNDTIQPHQLGSTEYFCINLRTAIIVIAGDSHISYIYIYICHGQIYI
jgi:hypothetical protein